ncbi:hypothetical protein RF11_05758 [Thelohanellus kitauei]|uniref:Uncharacterized protein n=1 Tax=Thelohanellus kitauei TaxID=669202 RepID=A0A0C2JSA5_THEKT|nr:hypothetical protein RF11_05758 [Thelohanellus kitauei]
MPRYRMYISADLRYNTIADYMSRKDFEDMGETHTLQYLQKKSKSWGFKGSQILFKNWIHPQLYHLPELEFCYSALKDTATAQKVYCEFRQLVQFSRAATTAYEIGILFSGNVAYKPCPKLVFEEVLQKAGRESFDQKVDMNSGVFIIRLLDNGTVQVSSTYGVGNLIKIVKIWDRTKHKFIDSHI